MFSAAFIFESLGYDDRFHELNTQIAEVARAAAGFIGTESWRSADGKRSNATYYWRSLEELKVFSQHPVHAQAKREYRSWYSGYHIVIAEVLRSYGDDAFTHFTPNDRASHTSNPDEADT